MVLRLMIAFLTTVALCIMAGVGAFDLFHRLMGYRAAPKPASHRERTDLGDLPSVGPYDVTVHHGDIGRRMYHGVVDIFDTGDMVEFWHTGGGVSYLRRDTIHSITMIPSTDPVSE